MTAAAAVPSELDIRPHALAARRLADPLGRLAVRAADYHSRSGETAERLKYAADQARIVADLMSGLVGSGLAACRESG